MNFWLGWLLKGKCEISLLDVLVLGFEFLAVVLFLVLIQVLIKRIKEQA